MKKLLFAVFLFLFTLNLTLVSSANEEYDIDYTCSKDYNGATLYVLNWGDYMDPELINDFETRCNVEVIYEEATSNETMRTNLLSGRTKYDILMPSDWMVDFLNQENQLSTLNKDLIPNFVNIDDNYKNLSYDANNAHSVPYFWGTVGIMYNKEELAELGINESELNDWNILWDERLGDNDIQLYESVRDVFMISLKSDEESANTTDKAKIDAAKDKLVELNEVNKLKFASDTIKTDVVDGNAVIGVTFNGDYLNMYSELLATGSEVNIGWAFPEQGTNKWYDNFVIPNVSENKELAHEFINYFLDEKVSYYNAVYVGYSTPNKAALEYLRTDEVFKDLVDLEAYIPSTDVLSVSEAYTYPGTEIFDYYNTSFQQFRNETSGGNLGFIIGIVAVVIALGTVVVIKKRRNA